MGCGVGCRRLGLLLWKNALTQWRSKCWSCCELSLPIVFLSFLIIALVLRESFDVGPSGPMAFDRWRVATDVSTIDETFEYFRGTLHFAPTNDEQAAALISEIRRYFWDAHNCTQGHSDEAAMLSELGKVLPYNPDDKEDPDPCDGHIGGIFVSSIKKDGPMEYSIRRILFDKVDDWMTTTFGKMPGLTDNISNSTLPQRDLRYWRSGFLQLQRITDEVRIRMLAPGATSSVFLQPMPRIAPDIILTLSLSVLPAMLWASFFVTLLFMLQRIIAEKEDGLKEYMKVMGLSSWMHWLAAYVVSMIKMTIIMIYAIILLKLLLPKTSVTILILFLMMYASNVVLYVFAITTVFNSANLATAFLVLSWTAMFWIGPEIVHRTDSTTAPMWSRMAWMLNINQAFCNGINLISTYEQFGDGIGWSTSFDPLCMECTYVNMGHVFIMLLVDQLILVLFVGYVDAINPGSLGVAQKPWFPFLPSYWCPREKKEDDQEEESSARSTRESVPEGMEPEIIVTRLTKVWKAGVGQTIMGWFKGTFVPKKNVAVDGLSFKAFSGQVTCLLGHNGAGKTTTFAMLSGVTSPSSGKALIGGYSCQTAMSTIRQRLGLCPQHNVLFQNLTVKEHLKFFCRLKGRRFTTEEMDYLLGSLGMADKVKAKAKTLSGGMRRKLSLCIALIGGSEVVILDEPTAGMDPNARHETWKLIQEAKKTRTILLTTHYMDEADLLGDRIGIMARGKLQCIGSGMFLKSFYGAGYHLSVVFESSMSAEAQQTAMDAVLSTTQQHCSEGAQLEWSSAANAGYLLPMEHRNKFGELFEDLEEHKEDLSMQSFGVSDTTLEEVFLKVGRLAEGEGSEESRRTALANVLGDFTTIARYAGCALFLQQLRAMFIKRLIYLYRRWGLIIFQVVIPLVAVVLMGLLASGTLVGDSEGPLAFNLSDLSRLRGSTALWQLSPLPSDDAKHLMEKYKLLCKSAGIELEEVPPEGNMSAVMLDKYKEDTLLTVINKYAIGAIVDDFDGYYSNGTNSATSITGLFNMELVHTEAISLNMIDNAILMHATNSNSPTITTFNHPLPPEEAERERLRTSDDNYRRFAECKKHKALLSISLPLVLSFLTAGFAMNVVRERAIPAKHLQLMSGVHPVTYWLSNFLVDYALYFLVSVICVLTHRVLSLLPDHVNELADDGVTWRLMGSLCLFGWTSLPFVYCFASMFKGPIKATILLLLIIYFPGPLCELVLPLVVKWPDFVDPLKWIFYVLFPIFGVVHPIRCKRDSITVPLKKDTLADEPAENLYIVLAIHFVFGVIYWALLMSLEFDLFRKLAYAIGLNSKSESKWGKRVVVEPDEDVEAENELVHSSQPQEVALLADDLTKTYGRFCAVNKVNFHVDFGECFGLLGVNGAGKTSAFQMFTGEKLMTAGDAYVVGISIRDEWRQAGRHIGYCPQFDAVMPDMTGVETLMLYGRIRGVADSDLDDHVERIIGAVDIGPHAKKRAQQYSGGNRRRLSLGVALVGMPDLLLLDEPTAGVDPAARRTVWDCLSLVRQQGKSIVLTSHSMEECEALCTRLAIMVAGQFVCIGSPQHLKHRFGAGYNLQVKAKSLADVEAVSEAVVSGIPGTVCKETFSTHLTFVINRSDELRWSTLFSKMEELKTTQNIHDYSLSQTTLEQIFLDFSQRYSAGST